MTSSSTAMNKRSSTAARLAAAALALTAASAKVYDVSPGGLSAALDAAGPGDIMMLADGIYEEPIVTQRDVIGGVYDDVGFSPHSREANTTILRGWHTRRYEDSMPSTEKPPAVHPLCRKVFWGAAGLAWFVWVLAVSAAGDEHWGELPTGEEWGVGTEMAKDACAEPGGEIDSFCNTNQTFEACQIVATVLCSVAVLFFTVAFFRPYDAERGSSKSLGVVGGVFMSLFAFFQMVSFLLQDKSIREYNAVWARFEQDSVFDAESGHTFGVGVAAFVFGLVQATVVLFCFRHAGHGPLLSCAHTQSLTPRPVYADPLPQRKSVFFSTPQATGGGDATAASGFSTGNPKTPSASDDGMVTASV